MAAFIDINEYLVQAIQDNNVARFDRILATNNSDIDYEAVAEEAISFDRRDMFMKLLSKMGPTQLINIYADALKSGNEFVRRAIDAQRGRNRQLTDDYFDASFSPSTSYRDLGTLQINPSSIENIGYFDSIEGGGHLSDDPSLGGSINEEPFEFTPSATSSTPTDICKISYDEFSEYKINYKDVLGTGGYGTVYSAVNIITRNSNIAIKRVRTRVMSGAGREGLLRECRIINTLHHPNIISLYGTYSDDSFVYFIMEKLDGISVGQWIDKLVLPPKPMHVINIFRQMVAAIAYCHRRDVIHRDIKPDNFVFRNMRTLEIVAIDFGLSDIQSPYGTVFYNFCGTPLYSAPEILNYVPYAGRPADCWALGVVLYSMTLRKHPFDVGEEGTISELRQKVHECDPYIPFDIGYKMSSMLTSIFRLEPSTRITADEMLQHPLLAQNL